MENNKAVVMKIAGGLGNQLFQYAMGKSLAYRNDSQLILDNLSGFQKDPYKRRFLLNQFNIKCSYIKPRESYVNLMGSIRNRLQVQRNKSRSLLQYREKTSG